MYSCRGALWAVVGACLLSGCGMRATTRTHDFDGTGLPNPTATRELTFVGLDRAQLDKARELERNGDYEGAIEILEGLDRKAELSSEVRQEVLLNLGELHGAWLNPQKDYDAATRYLQRLLRDFPETTYRARAEQLLDSYAKAQAR